MSKQLYDQISFVFSGPKVHDYTNYIATRTHWDDASIHDEAHFFQGFAHGMQVRVRDLDKPCQQVMDHGETGESVKVSSTPTRSSNNMGYLAPDAHVLAQQRGNLDKAKARAQSIAKPSGKLSATDGITTPSVSLPKFQPPVTTAARKGKNIMAPIIKNLAENNTDKDYFMVSQQSAQVEKTSDEADFDEAMEQWLEEQAARK